MGNQLNMRPRLNSILDPCFIKIYDPVTIKMHRYAVYTNWGNYIEPNRMNQLHIGCLVTMARNSMHIYTR